MKNITISVDDGTYRLSRIQAAKSGTTVTALVREYLRLLAEEHSPDTVAARCEISAEVDVAIDMDPEYHKRRKRLNEVVDAIHTRGGGLRMAENLPREELYRPDAFR